MGLQDLNLVVPMCYGAFMVSDQIVVLFLLLCHDVRIAKAEKKDPALGVKLRD